MTHHHGAPTTNGCDEKLSTPFDDLDAYMALPRMSGLTLSPDGTRLVVGCASLDAKSTAYRTALWEVDPAGTAPAVRLTRGAKGESGAAFTCGGDLLFTAARPDSDGNSEDDAPAGLWRLPARGGEAELVALMPGGVSGLRTARSAPVLLASTSMLASAVDTDSDEKLRKARKDNKVSAILHSGYPVRYWDADLGPDAPHLVVAELARDTSEIAGVRSAHLTFADLAPAPGQALREAHYDVSADGSMVATSWQVAEARGSQRSDLMLFNRSSGAKQVLVSGGNASWGEPAFSPDGSYVACVSESVSTPLQAPVIRVHLVNVADRSVRQLAASWDRWPASMAWLPDGTGLLITADDNGRSPIFHLDLASDHVTRITHDDAAYTDLQVAPDGSAVYALRSSYAAPAHPVRVVLAGDCGVVTPLQAPAPNPDLPGALTEVATHAADGHPVRGWLAMPAGASSATPAPLLLWIHGGPLGSWNAWSWRWNPWLMVAAGYAVLLPDPALSTGYGQEFIQRGWGAWGGAPYTDLLAVTDAAIARADIDASRTAAMGGSFGGYMANWVAGHTDRFSAIVTHASLWALDQFGPTTDASYYWGREMSPEMSEANSPHHHVGKIVTPMLVIHGDRDYRVPIGEGLRLWYELISKSQLPIDDDGKTAHRLLYFPNENHWVLSPQHAKIWYEVVLGFLAEHVLGQGAPTLPELLG
ncbi:S9 family peptidase [Nakamurella antarctica]|uniref:S9 family peptidase n=1 Tax=Nakamurella antarctica TaxID=1902245 RepID=A0A3G8ZRZ2_9ACTN|nr:prolyl oligopeptidase family serine peptidase [Nakamurella antarctica]AZI57274.1 S9 family peptidase [Nakamurella antarctica]